LVPLGKEKEAEVRQMLASEASVAHCEAAADGWFDQLMAAQRNSASMVRQMFGPAK